MMPKIRCSSYTKKAKENFKEDREQLLGCDKRDDRKDRGKHSRQKQTEWPARGFCDCKKHEAGAKANKGAHQGAEKSKSERLSHGANENGTDCQAVT